MERVAVIGAGISGLSVARLLQDRYAVKVFEKETVPGGLIRCRRVEGSLFHLCGGHVFNSRRQDVLDWFWGQFDRGREFRKADRNAAVAMADSKMIPYPVENHFYLFPQDVQKKIIGDLLQIAADRGKHPDNFEDFLRMRFGETLYELYFKPYNEKVWRRPLNRVPLDWLEGKLPMPSPAEMLFNNINHVKEKCFVHASFWYGNTGGSQFIADRLSEGLDICYGVEIDQISYTDGEWRIAGEKYDKVIFCGNVKDLPRLVSGVDMASWISFIEGLEYHGTTAVFCELDANPYSWVYQPGAEHRSHRIICTGNFSPTNNAPGKMTGTVEFTDEVSKDEILDNLQRIPFHPRYITHHYSPYTYPIQGPETRRVMAEMKAVLAENGLYLCGRFADWEYYNMDVAVGAAMDLCRTL